MGQPGKELVFVFLVWVKECLQICLLQKSLPNACEFHCKTFMSRVGLAPTDTEHFTHVRGHRYIPRTTKPVGADPCLAAYVHHASRQIAFYFARGCVRSTLAVLHVCHLGAFWHCVRPNPRGGKLSRNPSKSLEKCEKILETLCFPLKYECLYDVVILNLIRLSPPAPMPKATRLKRMPSVDSPAAE